MISEPCLAGAAPLESLAEKVKAFLVIAELKAKEGLSVAEFGELFLALMRLCIEVADTLPSPGPERKALVLDSLAMLFDAVADKMVPLYAWPAWLIFRPAVRAALLSAASGAIEIVLKLVRSQS